MNINFLNKQSYQIVGQMSGTSLDGVDLVYVTLWYDVGWNFKIHHAETISYASDLEHRLRSAIHLDMDALRVFDVAYTEHLGQMIRDFIERHQIKGLDAVCSHGHTILHQPDQGLTYQIGNRPTIATIIGEVVVCDFRVQDVQLGGQGAPLVPIGDRLLFSEYDSCINLGGFSNISFEKDGQRIAYDICPANIVLNYYAKQKGLSYDAGGVMAANGNLNRALLDALNQLTYYELLPPKSLGLEWVQSEIFPLIDAFDLTVEDILHTFVHHIAMQISKNIGSGKAFFTGGGAYNDFLMNTLVLYTDAEIIIGSPELVDYKEALIFAFLGVLRLRNEVNCLSSVTGACRDHSSGRVFELDKK